MPNIANATWNAPLQSFAALKLATKTHAAPISKPAAVSFTHSASSQPACIPVFHHRIKGALSN
jgi:hypothetical protein